MAYRRTALFWIGSLLGGGATFGAFGLVGQVTWSTASSLLSGIGFLASAILLLAWYLSQGRQPRASTGRQINRRLAQSGGMGAFAYGVVLGVGLLTVVATPAVWLGLGLSLLLGSWAWGLAFGVGFGSGRSAAVAAELFSRSERDIGMRVLERQLSRSSPIRFVGVATGVGLLAVGSLVLWA